jgi:hypothetical protein
MLIFSKAEQELLTAYIHILSNKIMVLDLHKSAPKEENAVISRNIKDAKSAICDMKKLLSFKDLSPSDFFNELEKLDEERKNRHHDQAINLKSSA